MDWKRLFISAEGRVGRKEFWIGQLILTAASFVVSFLLAFSLAFAGIESDDSGDTVGVGVGLLTLYPAVCITVKRLHDLNRSGWWMLALAGGEILIAIIAFVVTLGLGAGGAMLGMVLAGLIMVAALGWMVWVWFWPGTPGANHYGEPKSGALKLPPPSEALA